MRGNRAGARGICCKAWCSASTVGMPSTGNAISRKAAKGKHARRTPITAAWARMPIALAGNGVCQPIPRSGPICWIWPCGGKSVRCWPIRSGSPKNIGAACMPPDARKRQAQATLEAQIGKLRQGLARLIDSYAEGLIDKHEFEPRITRLRQRLAALGGASANSSQDEAALHTELQLIIGRLEDFAATGPRRAGGCRLDEQTRADPCPGEAGGSDPGSGQCRLSGRSSIRQSLTPEKKVCNFVGGVISPVLANMALDGLERILRKKYPHSGPKALKGMNKQVNLVRYCDDFLITGISKEVLEQEVKPLVTDFLWERGLELSEEKTTHNAH